jgi:hypothetical protein
MSFVRTGLSISAYRSHLLLAPMNPRVAVLSGGWLAADGRDPSPSQRRKSGRVEGNEIVPPEWCNIRSRSRPSGLRRIPGLSVSLTTNPGVSRQKGKKGPTANPGTGAVSPPTSGLLSHPDGTTSNSPRGTYTAKSQLGVSPTSQLRPLPAISNTMAIPRLQIPPRLT